MRVLSQTELSRMSKAELSVLLHAIVCELPRLREGSLELLASLKSRRSGIFVRQREEDARIELGIIG
jgi:hypothetical protein